MRTAILFSLFMFPVLFQPAALSQAGKECSSCSSVERALKDIQNLKIGMTRKDIESHNFVVAGGLTFRDHTAYVYRGCEYIHLEVDFSLDPAISQDMSPKDIIVGFSKLTLDYPAKD